MLTDEQINKKRYINQLNNTNIKINGVMINMDKLWKHTKWKKSVTKNTYYAILSIYNEMSIIVKSIKTESILVVEENGNWGEMGSN